jgi:hypothetical protein
MTARDSRTPWAWGALVVLLLTNALVLVLLFLPARDTQLQ